MKFALKFINTLMISYNYNLSQIFSILMLVQNISHCKFFYRLKRQKNIFLFFLHREEILELFDDFFPFLLFFLYNIFLISIIFHILMSLVRYERKTRMEKFPRTKPSYYQILSKLLHLLLEFLYLSLLFPLFLLYCRIVLFHCLPLLCFPSCFCRVVAFRLVVRFLFLHRLVFFSTVSTAFSLPFLFPPIPIRAPRPVLFFLFHHLVPPLPFPLPSPFPFSFFSLRGLHPGYHRDNENGREPIGHSIN